MTTHLADEMIAGSLLYVPLLPEHQQTQLHSEAILATLAAMYTELKTIRAALLPPAPIHYTPHQPTHSKTEHPVSIHPDALRYERERRGWTQAKVAEAVSTNPLTVSRWERGISKPSPYFREKLSGLFGVSIEQLGLLSTHTAPCGDPAGTISPCSDGSCSDCGGSICAKCGLCHFCNDIALPC